MAHTLHQVLELSIRVFGDVTTGYGCKIIEEAIGYTPKSVTCQRQAMEMRCISTLF